jgi:hypothetical protein
VAELGGEDFASVPQEAPGALINVGHGAAALVAVAPRELAAR